MAINITRIPVTFVFDAPESTIEKVFQTGLGGTVGIATWTVGAAAKLLPALAGSGITSLANKIVLPMIVNPTSITVAKNPLVSKTITKRGILNQFWQSEPDLISFQGRAASNRAFFILSQLSAMMQTMEQGTRNRVTMIYKYGGVYTGYFMNFRTGSDSMQPGVFDYSFDFQFADRKHFQLFLFAIKPSILNEAIQTPGKFITETVKLGASELGSTSGISLGKAK